MKKNLEKILKYGKRAGAILSTAFALSFLSLGEVEAQTREDFLNVYLDPSNLTLIYNGSGDADSSNFLDWNDYNTMVVGDKENIMMDVDLDSVPNTSADQEILAQYLRGDIDRLPSQAMRLRTRAEKDDRLSKILRIDQTSKIPPSPTWVSVNYGEITSLNGMGYWDPNDPNILEKYKEFSHLFGKLHTKIYFVGINFPVGPGHGAAGYFSMGDSLGSANDTPTNFSAWNFFEPRNDQINIQPGDWNMRYGSVVNVFGVEGFKESGGAVLFPVVAFKIDSVGNDSLIYEAPGLVTERPFDETKPEISITHPKADSTYKSLVSTLRYDFAEENPRVCLYSTDGIVKIHTSCGETITGLQSRQGANKWYLFADDLFGNISKDSVEFSVDTTKIDTTTPTLSITSPVDSTYRSHRTDIEYSLFDENPGDSIRYSLDNGLTRKAVPWGKPITGLQSEDGLNKWLIYAKDAFGNIGKDSVEFSVDTTTIGIGVDSNISIPESYGLKQNYPNPFNSVTVIKYTLPQASKVSLVVYNVKGQEIARLEDGDQSLGTHYVTWNASTVPSGIYFYRLRAGDYVETRKMVLLR